VRSDIFCEQRVLGFGHEVMSLSEEDEKRDEEEDGQISRTQMLSSGTNI